MAEYTAEQVQRVKAALERTPGIMSSTDPRDARFIAGVEDMRSQGLLPILDEVEPAADLVNSLNQSAGVVGRTAAQVLGGAPSLVRNAIDIGLGFPETAYQITAGTGGAMLGGLSAMGSVPYRMYNGATFGEALIAANEDMNSLIGSLTWAPRTSSGKVMLGALDSVFRFYDEGAKAIAQTTADSMFGSGPVIKIDDGSVSSQLGVNRMDAAEFMQLNQDFRDLMADYRRYADNNETPPAKLMEDLAAAREALPKVDSIEPNTANNIMYMTTKTLLDFAPDIASTGRASFHRGRARRQVEQSMREMGLDPKQSPLERQDLLQQQVNRPGFTQEGVERSQFRVTEGDTVRGQDLGSFAPVAEVTEMGQRIRSDSATLQGDIQAMEADISRMADALFTDARNSNNFVPTVELSLLDTTIANNLTGGERPIRFSERESPLTHRYVRDISTKTHRTVFEAQEAANRPPQTQPGTDVAEIRRDVVLAPGGENQNFQQPFRPGGPARNARDAEGPFESYSDLNELWEIRRNINNSINQYKRAGSGSAPLSVDAQNDLAGLYKLRQSIDTFFDASMERTAMFGNRESQLKWRQANEYYKDYIAKFNGQDFVRRMIDQDVSGEEALQAILGLGNTTNKTTAARAVQGVAEIFGYESAQMDMLRNSMTFKMFEPLFGAVPDPERFVKTYENFMVENNTVMREMFDPEQLQKMQMFREIVAADFRTIESMGLPDGTVQPLFSSERVANAAALLVVPGNTGLAQAGFMLRSARNLLGRFSDTLAQGVSSQFNNPVNRFMGEYMGMDMTASLESAGLAGVTRMGNPATALDPRGFGFRSEAVRTANEENKATDWTLEAMRKIRDEIVGISESRQAERNVQRPAMTEAL